LELCVLYKAQGETPMTDLIRALRTTLLLVDDDVQQSELRALVLKRSGFTVLTANDPVTAISIMAEAAEHGDVAVNVAIVDYEMPVMNGCVLADYLRERYPELKIILHSGAPDIPESEMRSIDVFVPKGAGVGQLLDEVSVTTQPRAAAFDGVMPLWKSLSGFDSF
jgi:CheY-like chemotaxis protein